MLGKKGERIDINSGRSKNISVLGFLRRDYYFSPYVIECNVNRELIVTIFNSFIESLPKQRKSVIVIDNALTHTSHLFHEIKMEKQNVHTINLTTYSPELNIIEILWRNIKYGWMPFEAYDALNNSLTHILTKVEKLFTIKFA